MAEYSLKSGFKFDITNLLHPVGLKDEDIKKISDKIKSAWEEIQRMRKDGFIPKHLSKDGEPEPVYFSKLPYIDESNQSLNTPESIETLISWGESLRNNVDVIISFGIGGSFLGNKVIFDVQCGEFWNELPPNQRNGYPKYYFAGNNVDPHRLTKLLDKIVIDAKNYPDFKVVLQVISKSGGTTETMTSFFVAKERLESERINFDVVAVTDPREDEKETILHKLATKNGWRIFSVPDGVGGRFSVFSDVGLVTAVAVGFDIREFLRGAKDMDKETQSSDINENIALLNAVLKYLAYINYGRNIEVFMPYCDELKSLSEWYIQLLAESLGKRYDRDGNEVFYGRTPIVAVGTTDMHAQVQQHQEGTLDKVVQFVRIEKWENDPIIPNPYSDIEVFSNFTKIPMSKVLDAALFANAEAQISEGRFNAIITLPKLNAYYLGQIMYFLCLSVAYEGSLANVDAFNQPGVETYKKIMKTKLNE